jgi:hypothetical protein
LSTKCERELDLVYREILRFPFTSHACGQIHYTAFAKKFPNAGGMHVFKHDTEELERLACQ